MNSSSPKPRHDHGILKFPDNFLWGAATSAFQVEGNSFNTDWWEWEQTAQPPEKRSGLAANQYELYEEDFDLTKKLGHNAHRLSLEWSRIEPTEGVYRISEIEHYRKVLTSLKEKNIKVMLTLWHFTLPKWVADKGGWENRQTSEYFNKFVQKVSFEYKDLVDFWITLNEPTVYIYHTYINRQWPSSKKAWIGRQVQTFFNLVSAHKKAYNSIHKHSSKPVGLAHNVQSFTPFKMHSLTQHLSVYLADLINNHSFYFITRGHHDFYGLNYYIHTRFKNFITSQKLSPVLDKGLQAQNVSDLGWEIYPQGIFDVLSDFGNHLPIYITECGIASTNDDRRTRFLINYLHEIGRAISSGINVKGFFYWSLLDNLEWHLGYDPKFGLIEVDFETQKRTPRPSAKVYQQIIEHNGIPHYLLKLLGHGIEVEEVLNKPRDI